MPQNIQKNSFFMNEKFKFGFRIQDSHQNVWTIGDVIGQGGFGLIYSASKEERNHKNVDHVVKIEPKCNGTLFCEMHLYANLAKTEKINQFKEQKGLRHLGISTLAGSGICEYNENDYRFLVMERFNKDFQTLFIEKNGTKLDENFALYAIRQILYVLEYIHSKGYTHGDVKGANLMLRNDHELFLVDYGLANRFARDGEHQKYAIKIDAKHNGTIEYTSRDAHDGALLSRKGDLEILTYCLIHWLGGTLPWIDVLENKEEVHMRKISFMNSPEEFVNLVLKKSTVSRNTIKFIKYLIDEVNSLGYLDEPRYSRIQDEITRTLKACGYSNNETFSLRASNIKQTITVNSSLLTDDSDLEDEKPKKYAQTKPKSKTNEIRCDYFSFYTSDEDEDIPTKSNKPRPVSTKQASFKPIMVNKSTQTFLS